MADVEKELVEVEKVTVVEEKEGVDGGEIGGAGGGNSDR